MTEPPVHGTSSKIKGLLQRTTNLVYRMKPALLCRFLVGITAGEEHPIPNNKTNSNIDFTIEPE